MLRKVFIALLSLFTLISLIPYLIPIPSANSYSYDKVFLESEYLDIDGINIHYRKWTPDMETINGKILMVHGLGGSTFAWRHNINYLEEKGYIVVAVDLPGFGYSDRKPGVNHSQKERSKILWKLLDTIDLSLNQNLGEMSWILVGHSMGGGTVAAMTMDNLKRTKGLVMVDGAVFNDNSERASKLLNYPPFARWIKVLFSSYFLDTDRFSRFLSSAYGRKPSIDEVQGYLIPLSIPGTADAMIDLTKTANNEPIEKLMEADVPILAIWGDNDTWVPLDEANKIKEVLPKAELIIIKGVTHCPMETNYREFNSYLMKFIENKIAYR